MELFRLQGQVSISTNNAETALRRVDAGGREAARNLQLLERATGRTRSVFDATGTSTRRMADEILGVGRSARTTESLLARMRGTGATLDGIGRKLTFGLTAPLTALGGAAVRSATEMDSLKRGLIAVAGSSDEAEKQLARLKEVAKLPGLGLKEAIQGSINLQAAGYSADLAERSLKAFGNALATVGKGKADLDGVILALGQIESKGKVSAEEINQIAERVPQIRKAMQAAFGTADTEVLQKANLSARQFVEGVTRELEKLPKVTGGARNAFENLSDTAQQSLEKIGVPILRTVIPAIDRMTPKVEGLANQFAGLSPQTQDTILALTGVGLAAGPLASILGNTTIAIAGIAGAAGKARAALSGAGGLSGAIGSMNPVVLGITGTLIAGAAVWYDYARASEESAARIRAAADKAAGTVRLLNGETSRTVNYAGTPVTILPGRDTTVDLSGLPQLKTGKTPDFGFSPLNPDGSRPDVSKPKDDPAEALRKRIQAAGLGGGKRTGGGVGTKAKELTEAEQLQKRLTELNQEIGFLSRVTGKEYALKLKLDGAEDTRNQLNELLGLQRELGLAPKVPAFKVGKGQLLDLAGLRSQVEILRSLKESTPAQTINAPLDERFGMALEIESQRLEKQGKVLEQQAKVAEWLTGASDSLAEQLAGLRDKTEAGRVVRELTGRGVALDNPDAQRLLSLAKERDEYDRQEEAHKRYQEALEESRRKVERFSDALGNTFDDVFDGLLGGKLDGKRILKNLFKDLSGAAIANATGGKFNSPGQAIGGALGGLLFGRQRAQITAGATGANAALGMVTNGPRTENDNLMADISGYGGAPSGGSQALSTAQSIGSAFGGAGGNTLNSILAKDPAGILGNLTGKGGFLSGIKGLFSKGGGSFFSKLGGLFGFGGGASGAASGGAAAASGLASAIPFIGLGISIGLPFLLKAFGQDYRKSLRRLIASEYGLQIKDNSTLDAIKQIGESKYGKEFPKRHYETVRLPETREYLYEYAKARGLKGNSKLFSAAVLQDPFSAMNVQRRAMGGVIHGPGTGTSDSVPAWLSKGEGVITAKAVGYYGGAAFINRLNRLEVPRFAGGGVAGEQFNPELYRALTELGNRRGMLTNAYRAAAASYAARFGRGEGGASGPQVQTRGASADGAAEIVDAAHELRMAVAHLKAISPDDIITKANPDTVTRQVASSYRRASDASREIRRLNNKF